MPMSIDQKAFWTLPRDVLFEMFQCTEHGLSSQEAAHRLEKAKIYRWSNIQ